MHILIAPDKFKGSLAAADVAAAIAAAIRRENPAVTVDLCPMADGGEGTVDALVAATGGTFQTRRVTGPLPEMKVDARFGILGDRKTAVIEMAAASGLALLKPEDRDPTCTTTFGTGELLMAAANLGVASIILGIGGSATIDGGIGCAQACQLPVILRDGEPLSPTEPLVGGDLDRVVLIKHGRGSPIEKIPIQVACDVTNPLCGPQGAAFVYGPQKGATPEQIRQLDAALLELARRNEKLPQANLPGAGAAGGLGFGMVAFFGATLRSGIEIVMDSVNFSERLARADLCITGEGRFDAQSLHGKTVAGVARACQAAKVPCVVLAGLVDESIDFSPLGIAGVHAVADPTKSPAENMANARQQTETAAGKFLRPWIQSKSKIS
jgi:glycerate 2-kinase